MPKKWKLKWAFTTQKTANVVQSYDFFRMDDRVTLVYSANNDPLFKPADDEFVSQLTPEQADWLADCITAVNAQKAQKQKSVSFKNDCDFMQRFEEELRKEKEMIEGKGDEAIGAQESESNDQGENYKKDAV